MRLTILTSYFSSPFLVWGFYFYYHYYFRLCFFPAIFISFFLIPQFCFLSISAVFPTFVFNSLFSLLFICTYLYFFWHFTIFNISLYFLSCNSVFFLKSPVSDLAKDLQSWLSVNALRPLINEYRRIILVTQSTYYT